MKRRGFLTGLMGAAVATALPLPAVAEAVCASPVMPSAYTGMIQTNGCIFIYQDGICRVRLGDPDAPYPDLPAFIEKESARAE